MVGASKAGGETAATMAVRRGDGRETEDSGHLRTYKHTTWCAHTYGQMEREREKDRTNGQQHQQRQQQTRSSVA